LLAINFCIQQLNAGHKSYLRQAFLLYQEGLNKALFIEDGTLDRFTYNNIALAGLGLKEFDWTISFLDTFKEYIPLPYRTQTYKYNLANLYYKKGAYEKALPLLQFTDFKDVLHNLEARKILSIIYFDTGEFDALESLLISFTRYIRRQDDLGYHKKNYQNFAYFLQKIIRLHPKKEENKRELKENILLQERVAEKEWLLGLLA